MSLIDHLAGLGLVQPDPKASAAPASGAVADGTKPVAPQRRPAPLERGSAVARALYSVWTGERVVIVDSPPGGGKTTLTVTIAAHLVQRANLRVTIAAPNRAQVVAMANRLTEQIEPAQIALRMSDPPTGALVTGIVTSESRLPSGKGGVVCRTLASMAASRSAETGILIVDEAYQATFVDVAAAAGRAEQVLMVGDPGQIGPVVTVDCGAWETLRNAPHRPAPVVFGRREGAVRVSIDKSFRLGRATVEAIAPVYPFPFASARPHRALALPGGQAVPEIVAVRVPEAGTNEDPGLLGVAADRVAALVGAALTETDRDGAATTRPVEPSDVAVVVALNSQVSIVTGMLTSRGLGDVSVGTADSMQGGEWPLVVAVDPTAGGVASEHHMSLGRLCVMASRHTTHLTWVHDGSWETTVTRDASVSVRTAVKVRRRLTGPVQP